MRASSSQTGQYAWGVLLTPARGAGLMAVSMVVGAINARMLRLRC